MDHMTPCGELMNVVHGALVLSNSLTLVLAAWLAQRRHVADKDRKSLHGEIRRQMMRDLAVRNRLEGDQNGDGESRQ